MADSPFWHNKNLTYCTIFIVPEGAIMASSPFWHNKNHTYCKIFIVPEEAIFKNTIFGHVLVDLEKCCICRINPYL